MKTAEESTAPRVGVERIVSCGWLDISTAPKDGSPILGLCNHEADPYFLEDENHLTLYGGHVEGMSHAENGPHVLVWGGAWDYASYEEPNAGRMPDWWFVYGSEFEVAANPTHWMPIPKFDS